MSHRRKRNLQKKRAEATAEWKRKMKRVLLFHGVPAGEVERIVRQVDPNSIATNVNAIGKSINFVGIGSAKGREFHLLLPSGSDPSLRLFGAAVADTCRLLDRNPHVSLATPRYFVIGAPVLGDQLAGTTLTPDLTPQRSLVLEASPRVSELLEVEYGWANEAPWILVSLAAFQMHLPTAGPRFALYDLADTLHHEALHVDGVEHNPELVTRLRDTCRWNAETIEAMLPKTLDRGPTAFATLVERHIKLQARFIDEEANLAFRERQKHDQEALWESL